MKQARIHTRINEDLKKEFDKKCKDEMRVPSVIIRALMKEYIERGQEIFKKENGEIEILD